MSLTHRTAWEVVKQQFLYKLRSNAAVFTVLFVLQIISMVLMNGAAMTSEMGTGSFELEWNSISTDGVMGLTFFWAMVFGFLMTTPGQRNAAYLYVATPLTENLANFCLFGFASLIAGITTVLSGGFVKLLAQLQDVQLITETAGLFSEPYQFFTRVLAMAVYTFLTMMIVYTIFIIIQRNRLLILPFILLWFAVSQSTTPSNWLGDVIDFFYNEHSILLFLGKAGVTAVLMAALSLVISKRIEVKVS
ncbi:hypothetical protein DVB69_13995 [Sporosarcina sp. BI001-red]|uniref:hypothetical protein n=1 Tax=Sporosarcina sp. BI001-red TaxID=2282866 RepID=UPI000E28A045|nr:hypothetical protein [Sporosarcina sp. BI001-red]REB06043.1 hypothetical protein DVB69_13995 [Sporosarcina sp. BI001-red]